MKYHLKTVRVFTNKRQRLIAYIMDWKPLLNHSYLITLTNQKLTKLYFKIQKAIKRHPFSKKTFKISTIRRMYPTTIAHEIASVQPIADMIIADSKNF